MDEPHGPKEKAYDDLISPLMTQIIALCKEHRITVFAHYELDDYTDEDGEPADVSCTTCIPQPEDEPKCRNLMVVARPRPQFAAFTIMTGPKT
jgi:hypothetical protein